MSKSTHTGTLADRMKLDRRAKLSLRERAAINLLARDGWDRSVLRMCFECSESTIHRTINDDVADELSQTALLLRREGNL